MLLPSILLSLLPILPVTLAADSKPAPKPCTIHSPSTGSYFDLSPLDLSLQQQSSKSKDSRTESWHAKGYDYPANFTLNICGPVIESLENVSGIPEARWQNISAFYKANSGDKTYSIGQSNSELIFRGRKLLLNYTNGSPCPDLDEDGNPQSEKREIIGGDDDDEDDKKGKKTNPSKPAQRHKSTLLSLICDRDPTLSTHPSLAFLGSPDHCIYIFEARSRYFCGGTTSSSEPGSLGPGGVFGVVIGIALLAYLVGGCAYQRTVMRQRGWRQCPNYAVWMGLVGFFTDMFTILFSSCTRNARLPTFSRAFNSRSGGGGGGYHRVGEDDNHSSNNNNGQRRRGGSVNGSAGRTAVEGRNGSGNGRAERDAEENRLIDRLDEEWDDYD